MCWPFWSSVALAGSFAIFGWLLLTHEGCQSVSEVQPSQPLWVNRLPFHLAFIFLLAAATITDYLDYVIPDQIVISGIALALIAATCSGDLQVIHVWVDWSYDQQLMPDPTDPNEFVLHYGPYLPAWMKHHQHLHGFIWSLSGLLAGAGLMWLARVAANAILGVPAIGFGDVTLMAMIGAFMGWQPTLCALAIAPLVGIVLGLGGRIVTGRSFVAFGPYLCFGAFIVLCSWRMLWQDLGLRVIFSHWQTISGLVGGSFIVFCILLVALRLFKATPASRLKH
ncbi:MAG: prepilin peptidase [Planctomycetota bacterium]